MKPKLILPVIPSILSIRLCVVGRKWKGNFGISLDGGSDLKHLLMRVHLGFFLLFFDFFSVGEWVYAGFTPEKVREIVC